MSDLYNRALCAFGGLFGAAGIASYAAAAHIGGDYGSMAIMFLGNAPILIIMSFIHTNQLLFRLASVLILLGTCLFEATVGIKQCFGLTLLPYMAPIGGTTVLIGWLMFTIAAFVPGNFIKH